MIVSNMTVKRNNIDEICTYCRNVSVDENGNITGCKKGRKNSGNNNKVPCVGCKRFVKAMNVEMPYFLRKEAEKL